MKAIVIERLVLGSFVSTKFAKRILKLDQYYSKPRSQGQQLYTINMSINMSINMPRVDKQSQINTEINAPL